MFSNKRFLLITIFILILITVSVGCRPTKSKPYKEIPKQKQNVQFTKSFNVKKNNLASIGRNPFFILEPGYTLLLKGEEEGKPAAEETRVLNQTKVIDGVETRVVKETHSVEGKIDEISLNYFAIDKVSNSVFYFGEDTDIFENGKVVSNEGSWHSGEKGAKFGLIMPGIQLLGGRYMQEIAPDVALDRAEIISVNESVKSPAGDFNNCLKVKESSPLEPGVSEFKLYAPSVGKIQDANLKLVKFGFIK